MNPLITRLFPTDNMLQCFRRLVAANERRTGQKAPRHYHEWISRVQQLHEGRALTDVLTAEEFAALKEMAIDAENKELWSVLPTQVEIREVTQQPKQAMLDAQVMAKAKRGGY